MSRGDSHSEAERRIDEAARSGGGVLDLSYLGLAELPPRLWELTGLEELDLTNNRLTALPDEIGDLAGLLLLDLSGNRLSALPDRLFGLAHLRTLVCSGNKLKALPDTIGELKALEALYLDNNPLKALPERFWELTQLRTLYLSGAKLKDLPDSVGELSRLRTLELGGNALDALPERFWELNRLRTLDLKGNRLTELPERIGELVELNRLGLDGNGLKSLPDGLCELSQLRTLDVGNNSLTVLPERIGKLTRLQALDLSHNGLTHLPERLWELKRLRSLDLGYNSLTKAPDRIGELTRLETLYLDHNQLTELPEVLGDLEKLTRLYLHNNETGIPAEVLGPTRAQFLAGKTPAPPAKILDYYHACQGDKGRALRELKLIVVGRGGAGKTSLIRRLRGRDLNPVETETHGIKISPVKLALPDGPVTARVWDFGGQHVLHAMHEFFLTARSLYLLVLGEREDMAERDAAYWLQLIRSYAGKAPVIVALNKNKGRPREMDRESFQRLYGPIVAWVSTECSEGYEQTIDDLRIELIKAADRMKEIRDRFPKKWWEIKEWLEAMDDPFIDFDTYQQRCEKLGELDPEMQESLAARMSDLGIAINYADDDRLRDTTVLRPDWLSNGIYAILRANDPHHDKPLAPDATLTAEALGAVYAGAEKLGMLTAADYPPEKWPFLLRLMALFQLAFPLDEKAESMLVPTLLSLEPPPDCDEPEDEDRTRIRYEFAVVPGPLMPKMLVRTFSLIDGQRRWRRGAVLGYGEARARVWTTQDERWIRITAVGPADDREDLITMVRVTLDELFAEYKDLRVTEQWEHRGAWVPRETLEEFGVLRRSHPEGGSRFEEVEDEG